MTRKVKSANVKLIFLALMKQVLPAYSTAKLCPPQGTVGRRSGGTSWRERQARHGTDFFLAELLTAHKHFTQHNRFERMQKLLHISDAWSALKLFLFLLQMKPFDAKTDNRNGA